MSNIIEKSINDMNDRIAELEDIVFGKNEYVLAVDSASYLVRFENEVCMRAMGKRIVVAENKKRANEIAKNWNAEMEEKYHVSPVLARDAHAHEIEKIKEIIAKFEAALENES